MAGGFLSARDERHAAAIGFYAGFVAGYADAEDVAERSARRVFGTDDVDGHFADTRDEAAYAGGAFVVGFAVGRALR